jgi:hypothetical protein
MLTPNEREWLTHQRELLIQAANRADTYAGVLDAHVGAHARAWAPADLRRHSKARIRLELQVDRWHRETLRRQALITAWLAVYDVLQGQRRGPVQPMSTDELIRALRHNP